jgi:hypothetical protein
MPEKNNKTKYQDAIPTKLFNAIKGDKKKGFMKLVGSYKGFDIIFNGYSATNGKKLFFGLDIDNLCKEIDNDN